MARFIAFESVLVGLLVAVPAFLFWGPAHAYAAPAAPTGSAACCPTLIHLTSHLVILNILAICGLPIAAYWMLERLEMARLAFWLVALLGLALQAPAVFAHNGIDVFPREAISWVAVELGAPVVATLLVSSLALLVVLHRVADLRRMYAKFISLRIDDAERSATVANEIKVLGGVVGFSLFVAVTLVVGGLALAELDMLLRRVPWTVLTVGAIALCLLSYFFHLWLRRDEAD